MDWAANLYGLSEAFYNSTNVGGGVIQVSRIINLLTPQTTDKLRQTNASECAMLAIVAARSRYLSLYPDVTMDKLVIYVTTQTHSLGLKAGLVLGLPVHAFQVRAEDNYSLRGQDLRETIEMDRADGKHPFVMSEEHTLDDICYNLNLCPSRYRRYYLEWSHR